MTLVAGIVMVIVGIGLIFIAMPKDGEVVPFLRIKLAEVSYTLLIVVLIGLGIATMFGGLTELL